MINNDDIMIIFYFKNIAIFPVYRVTNYNNKSGFISQGGSNPLVTCFSGLVKSTSFISQGGLNPVVNCFSEWVKSTGFVSQAWLNPRALVLFLRVG